MAAEFGFAEIWSEPPSASWKNPAPARSPIGGIPKSSAHRPGCVGLSIAIPAGAPAVGERGDVCAGCLERCIAPRAAGLVHRLDHGPRVDRRLGQLGIEADGVVGATVQRVPGGEDVEVPIGQHRRGLAHPAGHRLGHPVRLALRNPLRHLGGRRPVDERGLEAVPDLMQEEPSKVRRARAVVHGRWRDGHDARRRARTGRNLVEVAVGPGPCRPTVVRRVDHPDGDAERVAEARPDVRRRLVSDRLVGVEDRVVRGGHDRRRRGTDVVADRLLLLGRQVGPVSLDHLEGRGPRVVRPIERRLRHARQRPERGREDGERCLGGPRSVVVDPLHRFRERRRADGGRGARTRALSGRLSAEADQCGNERDDDDDGDGAAIDPDRSTGQTPTQPDPTSGRWVLFRRASKTQSRTRRS